MKMRSPKLLILLTLVPFVLGGCLTAGRKVIKLHLDEEGKGTGSITFYNIMSIQENEEEQSHKDYTELVSTWIKGDAFERANPSLSNVNKRLFAEKGVLNGEVTFQFFHPLEVGLYRHNDVGPWMYFTKHGSSSWEQFDTCNGDYGGELMPVAFWKEGTTEFMIANRFDHADMTLVPLFPLYDKFGVSE